MISVRDLTLTLGNNEVLRGISFDIREGLVALLGRNGAGKSTLMRIMAGLWKPARGQVTIGGHDLAKAPVEAKRLLGYQPEFAELHPNITGHELLRFAAAARGVSNDALEHAIARFDASEFVSQRAGNLSQGQRRLITLVAATMHEPPALLLDEPTNALDPHRVAALRAYLTSPAGPRAALISTHQLEFVESLATRFILLREGTIAADGNIGELQEQLRMPGAALGELVLKAT